MCLDVSGRADTSRANHPTVPALFHSTRQKTSRRLNEEDNTKLVEQLKALDAAGVIEFENAFMENKSRMEQVSLPLRIPLGGT